MNGEGFRFFSEFALGDVLYLKMGDERRPGIVTGYFIYDGGYMLQLSWGNSTDSRHYPIEVTREYEPRFDS
jgi:hypothetical protein